MYIITCKKKWHKLYKIKLKKNTPKTIKKKIKLKKNIKKKI